MQRYIFFLNNARFGSSEEGVEEWGSEGVETIVLH
jgi:hypothetical protein